MGAWFWVDAEGSWSGVDCESELHVLSGLTTSGANIQTTQESKESTGRHTSSPSQHSDPLPYPYLVRGVNFRLVLLKQLDRPFVTLSPGLMQRRLFSLRRAAPRQS